MARKRGAEVILEDVVRLIDQLDDEELKEGQDLPFLELAKAASVLRLCQAGRMIRRVDDMTNR